MRGRRQKVHPLFIIFGIYFAFTGKVFSFISYTLCACIHELGHSIVAEKLGYRLIYGATKDRAEQVKDFQENPDVKVFVGQLQTTGMGLTLTAASVAVFYSFDFSYANYEQSRARIHRIGQNEKCLYIHLVAKNTVDEKIMNALKHKGDIAKLMVDNWRTLLHGKV